MHSVRFEPHHQHNKIIIRNILKLLFTTKNNKNNRELHESYTSMYVCVL